MTLDERIEALPRRDAALIDDYINFLLERRANPPKGPLQTAAERSKAYYADFAKRVAAVQAALQLTDKAAAASFGITLVTYRRYLAGAPVRKTMASMQFAERHNIALNYWIGGDGPMFEERPSLPHLGENVLLFQARSAVRS